MRNSKVKAEPNRRGKDNRSAKQPGRPDALFWRIIKDRLPKFKRAISKLERHTEHVHVEGKGHILRVTKAMKASKRGVYYAANIFNNDVMRYNAMVNVTIKPGTLIFLYADQTGRRLKLRSNGAQINSIWDLNIPGKKLGFAVSYFTKDSTNEQTAYVPGKSLRIRMRGFKDECGAGFHFYLFPSDVNAIWKH